MKYKIFVTLSTFAEFDTTPVNLLKESKINYSINETGHRLDREEIINYCKDADGIIAGVEPYDDFVLSRLNNLKCISRCGVGIDNISINRAKELKIEIRNTPDVVVLPVAELAIGMIFDLLKKISYHTILIKTGHWKKSIGFLLSGKKVGIIGLGRIGKKVAELLVKLNCIVLGSDIFPDKDWAKKNNIKIVSTEDLLKEADIVSIHVSVTNSNKFFLGEKEILKMKKGAFLINISRGSLIDEEAIIGALKINHLGGVALDVYNKEPYNGELINFENVVLTPHIATFTKESRAEMEIEATQNLLNFFKVKS